MTTYEDGRVIVQKEQYCPAVQILIDVGVFRKLDIGGLDDFSSTDFIKLYLSEKDYILLHVDSGVSRVKVRCKCRKCLNRH